MFDLRQAPQPFAMRPGLSRLAEGTRHLHPLQAGSALHLAKAAAWQHASSCLIAAHLPSGTLAQSLRALHTQAQQDAITSVALSPMESVTDDENSFKNSLRGLSMAVEEDLALLDARPRADGRPTGTLAWLNVTCPSHWAPEEKIGLPLAAVHAPVADNALLLQANAGLVALATRGERWERWVWTITPSAQFDAHPARHAARVWPSPDEPMAFLRACQLRSERQTFFPVLDALGAPSGMAIFTIRVMLTPLAQALPTPAHRHALRASLASMSPAVLQYKGLASALAPLLRALDSPATP